MPDSMTVCESYKSTFKITGCCQSLDSLFRPRTWQTPPNIKKIGRVGRCGWTERYADVGVFLKEGQEEGDIGAVVTFIGS